MICCLLGLYMLIVDYLSPILINHDKYSFLELFLTLIDYTFFIKMITFYMVMECFLNAYSELLRFSDRCFYEDWWNSSCYIEFNNKWNAPVSRFLNKYVYQFFFVKRKWTEEQASMATIAIFAVFHEIILIVALKCVKPFIFMLMIVQIPLYHVFIRF